MTVTATSSIAAQSAVAVTLDPGALGASADQLAVRAVPGSALPWTLDPRPSADPLAATLWVRLPDRLDDGDTATLRITRDIAGAPAALDAVFVAGEDVGVDPASSSLVLTTAGAAAVARTTGRLVVDMGADEGDAMIARLDEALVRDEPFTARHRLSVQSVQGVTFPPGLFRQLAVLQGAPPEVTQDNQEFFLREIITVVMAEDGAYVWLTLPDTQLEFWSGSAWTTTPFTAWMPFSSEELEVEVDSDGVVFVVRVFDVDGVLLTESTPRGLAELRVQETVPGQADPLWVFWGEPFAGPGAPYFTADASTDWVLLRKRPATEPDVVVTLE